MRAEVDLRAIERTLVRRFRVYAVVERSRRIRRRLPGFLTDRQVSLFQHSSIVGSDDVAESLGICGIGPSGIELGYVRRDQPARVRVQDRPHGSRLGHVQGRG